MTLTPLQTAMLLAMPPLLAISAFCSAAETALFGLGEAQRLTLRRASSASGRAVEALLAHPRQLLITILLANMIANVSYFVVSTVLLTHSTFGVGVDFAFSVVTVLSLILLGEVLPKMIANARRMQLLGLIAPVVLVIHRVIGPMRRVLDWLIVAPLSRLTAPRAAPPRLDARELAALLDVSGREGVIDHEEQRLLRDVIDLRRRRVRDVMTPRVRMVAIPRNATREQIIAATRESRLTKLPVYEGSLDHIVGELHVKRYLVKAAFGRTAFVESLARPRFVPDMITLDHLLQHFRTSKTQSAIVADEYGGTAGVVSIEDVVEQLVGNIDVGGHDQVQHPVSLGPDTWRVSGDMSIHDWVDAFGHDQIPARVSTLGGLVIERLGRVPQEGDVVELGNVTIRVDEVERSCVTSATITLNAGEAVQPQSVAGEGSPPGAPA